MRGGIPQRALVAFVAAVLLVDAAILGARALNGDDSASASVTTTTVVDSPVLDSPVPRRRPRPNRQGATTTTAPAVLLPTPIDPPLDAYADEPEVQLGRLQIPSIGLDTTFYDGITLTSIDRGPSHWPGTALPGQLGNLVLAGHRVTHSHPFRRLDAVREGDQAIFTTGYGTFTYEYAGTEIVDPARVDIVDQSLAYTATFFACHPPGSARQRIVVRWRMVGAPPAPGSLTVIDGSTSP